MQIVKYYLDSRKIMGITLEKTENFDSIVSEDIKKRLEGIFEKKFENFEDFMQQIEELPGFVYVPKEKQVKIDVLPFTIKEWPLYYNKGPAPYGVYEIAKIKVVD